jgi:HPt (histidine-containing phosphotransfer) domain-containing protein
LESHNQTPPAFPDVPIPTLSAVEPSLSPTPSTPELQVAIPSSPQFRFAEAISEASLSPSPSILLSEQPESFTVPLQFTAAKDQVKKDDQQAKVVPFPITSVQGSSLSFSLPPHLGSASSQNMLNLDEALNRVEGDRELLSEMAGVFLDEYPLLLVTMQDALSHGNAQTLTYAVHTLKGSVANFAATSVFEAALKLEKIGRQGNLTQAKTALAELEAELARLAPLLTTLKMEAAA